MEEVASKVNLKGRVMKEVMRGGGRWRNRVEEGHQRTALWGCELAGQAKSWQEVGPSAVIMGSPLKTFGREEDSTQSGATSEYLGSCC